jgi:hypothetical protein
MTRPHPRRPARVRPLRTCGSARPGGPGDRAEPAPRRRAAGAPRRPGRRLGSGTTPGTLTAQAAVSGTHEFAPSVWPCQKPSARVSETVATATMAVRRSSAAVAAIKGAMTTSESTTGLDVTASAQGTSSHKAAAAIATCLAGGHGGVFTPPHLLTSAPWASPSISPGSPLGLAMLQCSLPAVSLFPGGSDHVVTCRDLCA